MNTLPQPESLEAEDASSLSEENATGMLSYL